MKVLKFIRKWGYDKDLIEPGSKTQLLAQNTKSIEEANELRVEIKKGDKHKCMEELGDNVVTLEMQAANLETTLEECAWLAYNKIINRDGKTIETDKGKTFVKSEDL